MTVITTAAPINRPDADYETHATTTSKGTNVPPPPKNAVESHEANAAPPTNGPTASARDVTTLTSTGYAASPNTRGPSPEQSKSLNEAQQQVKDLQYILSIPAQEPFGQPGVVSLTWLRAVANDPLRSQASKDAANRLLNSGAWALADADHSGKLTLAEASAYAVKLQSSTPSAPRGATEGSVPGSSPVSHSDPATGTEGGTTQVAPKTYPSTLEGSLAGMYDAAASVQERLIKLQQEVAANPDKATSLQGEISKLTNQLQVLNNMTQLLQNLISNLAKMWNDIAMTAVQNIR